MDSTDDAPRPGSRTFRMKVGADRLAKGSRSATGQNVGPERRVGIGNDDAPRGTTSAIEPELRGKPGKGTRMDGDG